MSLAMSVEQQAESFVHSPHRLLIDGEWVEAASGQTFATFNPATEETLAEVAHGQAEDIDRAVTRRTPGVRRRLTVAADDAVGARANHLAHLAI